MRNHTFTSLALTLFVVSAAACGGQVADDDSAPDPSGSTNPQAAGGGGGGAAGGAAALNLGASHVPDEVLVQWKPGTSPAAKANARAKANGSHAETIHTGPMKAAGAGELEVMKLPAGLTVAAGVGALASDPNVDLVEPNWIYQHGAVEMNDTYASSLWGVSSSTPTTESFGSQATAAWNAKPAGADCAQYNADGTKIGDVYVGIIDEGYMFSHPELVDNAGTNPGEIAGNGIDDDGNGYIDDVQGWDFDGRNASVFDGAGDDHGTHVAGTIAARGGNGAGVAGICWSGIKLLSAKFLGKRGGTTANAVKAVDYFTDLKTKGLNIVATNNSWGGGGFSQALQDAIGRAESANVLFIAAAGNETTDNDAALKYPGNYPNDNIISVAALTSTGGLASYSNYGATKVDIGAPGSGIWSTIPKSSKRAVLAGYASYNGTSMATPHVTGAAAMYAGRHPGSTAAQIKAAILGSATPTASLSGKCVTGGRLNVAGF